MFDPIDIFIHMQILISFSSFYYHKLCYRGGWNIPQDHNDDSLSKGEFRQVGERGWSGVEEGEWRLSGDFGSREFSMREWEDNRVERAREGGEWDLRGGEVGGRVSMSDIGDSIASMLETGKEEDVDSCCCDQVTLVKILITMLALINLALVVTGCVGISITVLEHWSEQHLFTPVMVSIILITTIFCVFVISMIIVIEIIFSLVLITRISNIFLNIVPSSASSQLNFHSF